MNIIFQITFMHIRLYFCQSYSNPSFLAYCTAEFFVRIALNAFLATELKTTNLMTRDNSFLLIIISYLKVLALSRRILQKYTIT